MIDRGFLGSVVRFVVTPAGMGADHKIQIDVFNVGHALMPSVGEHIEFHFSADDCFIY